MREGERENKIDTTHFCCAPVERSTENILYFTQVNNILTVKGRIFVTQTYIIEDGICYRKPHLLGNKVTGKTREPSDIHILICII